MLRGVVLLVTLSAGCFIPGLDESGKECPCADGYACDDDTQLCVPLDASVHHDLSSAADMDLDAGTTLFTVDGEQILLAPGWRASLFSNFSAAYTYNVDSFDDSEPGNPEMVDNQPHSLVPLIEPFSEGFALLAGRQLIAIGDDGVTFTLKDFSPSAPNSGICASNPSWPCLDIPLHLNFAVATSSTPARLLTSSNSLGTGDGVVQLDSSFTPSMLLSGNNFNTVYFDASGTGGVGVFDPPQTAPQTYYAVELGSAPELSRFSGTTTTSTTAIIPYNTQEQGIDDVAVLSDGKMAAVFFVDDDLSNLGVVSAKSGTYPVMLQGMQSKGIHLATGATTSLPAGIFAIIAQATLAQVDETSGAPATLAQSSSLEWTWTAVTVPPATHALGKAGPVFYVLSSNRSASKQGIDHIIKLTPSF